MQETEALSGPIQPASTWKLKDGFTRFFTEYTDVNNGSTKKEKNREYQRIRRAREAHDRASLEGLREAVLVQDAYINKLEYTLRMLTEPSL